MRTLRSCAVILVATVAGCAGPDATALSDARVRWTATADDYRFDSRRWGCECLPEDTRTMRITVRGGVMAEAVFADDGQPVRAERLPYVDTIETLFDKIGEAIEEDYELIEVTYHPTLGYPIETRIADEIGNDGDSRVSITNVILE